ncbi:MAG TPA: hypothetical protein GXX55_01495 [Firmicutes bacterium]|nr:hypothetical protein [Bacillota bacterium]
MTADRHRRRRKSFPAELQAVLAHKFVPADVGLLDRPRAKPDEFIAQHCEGLPLARLSAFKPAFDT